MSSNPEQAFSRIITEDGSPSLNWLKTGESMHNRKGAFSETLHIYLPAIQKAHDNLEGGQTSQTPFFALSVGLGLGYNEILFAAYCLKNNLDGYIESYESELFLRQEFIHWLDNEKSYFVDEYNKVINLFATHFELNPLDIKTLLKKPDFFQLKGSLDIGIMSDKEFNIVFYDPYSSHTSPEFWHEDHLDFFVNHWCHNNCSISSYAAKGAFSRSLKKWGFSTNLIEGFGGKRQSTLAWRI